MWVICKGSWVLSIDSWVGVSFSRFDILNTSSKFLVDSFTSVKLLVLGVKVSASCLSWVCFRILFLIFFALWFFCCSDKLAELILVS